MIQTINQEQHPDYPQKFKDTVRYLLPTLCYTPDEAEAFIQEFEPQFDGKSYVIEDEAGQLTFLRYAKGNPGEIYIDYIIPSVWNKRYSMVKNAVLALKEKFLITGSEHQLRMYINEKLPSHNAYYAGLLAELGFDLTPRVTMIAEPALVTQLALPELPPNIQEVPYQVDGVEAVIDLFAQGYSGKNREELSAQEWTEAREDEGPYLRRIYDSEAIMQTWTGLACEGTLIACSFGDDDDDSLPIEEVVVVPKYHGMGLGRYVTIRCMQKLVECYGSPNKHFFLGTDRRWAPALKLYHRLGFTIDTVELYARLTNDSHNT